MARAKVDMIKGPLWTHEARAWNRWLKEAAQLAHQFGNLEDDPFSYNETATVSLLTAAAARVDMLALAEFVSTKQFRRMPVNGRCDLWICSERRSWAFEVKQFRYLGGYHRLSTIRGWLASACWDARKLAHHEAEKRFAILIIPLFWAEEIDEEFIKNVEAVAAKTDYAWRLSPGSEHTGETFVLFKEVRKKPAKKRGPKPSSIIDVLPSE